MVKLQEIGFNEYESKAYETLVKFDKATANRISTESEVPYSRIYDVLASLNHKGLIHIIPGDPKQYTISDPKNLLDLAEHRKNELTKTIQEIKVLEKSYDLNIKQPIVVGYGKDNFSVIVDEMKETEKYSYNIRYKADPKPKWIKRHQKKGIDRKNLTRYDEETKNNVKKWIKDTKTDWREINNEGVAISIKDDEETMICVIKSNATLLIRDKAFAKLMKDLYLAKWNISKEIKIQP